MKVEYNCMGILEDKWDGCKVSVVVVMSEKVGALVVNVQGMQQTQQSNRNVGVHAHMQCCSHLCHMTPC